MQPITGYEDLYELHLDDGTGQPGVWSKCRNRYLKPFLSGSNKRPDCRYKRVKLQKDNTVKNFQLHRLVAIHFIPNPGDLPQVDHIDGNKMNNNVDNLRWSTVSANNHNKPCKGYSYQELPGCVNCWHATICVNGKRINLGSYYLEIEAIEAYNVASAKYYPGIKE